MPLIFKEEKMKKYLLLILLLLTIGLNAQSMKVIGDTTDLKLYSDSKVVLLLGYGKGSDEGAGIFRRIDSTYTEDGVNAFAYPYAGYQWARVNLLSGGRDFRAMTSTQLTLSGDLILPSTVIGENVFTTTGETDTVVIAGALATDSYIVSGQFTVAIDQQDILQWEAIAGGLVVHRMASGESALKYSWLRIPTP